MLNGDTEEIDKNLKSWTVTSVSGTEIMISLIFDKPLLVSSDYYPDIIMI